MDVPTSTSSAKMGGRWCGPPPPHSSACLCGSLTKASSLPQVFCDMETSGGGWTTIQRRKSGLVSFYRDWKQYKQGFGSIRGDFWLGNDHIHRLSRRPTRLRVELEVSTRPRSLGLEPAATHTTTHSSWRGGGAFPLLFTTGLCICYDGFPAGCSTVEGEEAFSCFCFVLFPQKRGCRYIRGWIRGRAEEFQSAGLKRGSPCSGLGHKP